MGVPILILLLAGFVVILITPAWRERMRRRRDRLQDTAHEAVVQRLEDHRRRKKPGGDGGKDS